MSLEDGLKGVAIASDHIPFKARLYNREEVVNRTIGVVETHGGSMSSTRTPIGQYAKAGNAEIGFVSTNSITQGQQVAQLWPILFDKCGLEISFAHRTFAWGSDARGKAQVHVVILGFNTTKTAGNKKTSAATATTHARL